MVFLLFDNFKLISSGYTYGKWLGPIDLLVVVAGIGFAFYIKNRNPSKYESAGRLINEGL